MNTLRCWLATALIIAATAPFVGCRICADCEDLAYPAYGGAWKRTRRDSGRVGSIFDPAGAQSAELVARDSPPTPDQLERERQSEIGGDFGGPDRDSEDEDGDGSDERPDSNKTDELLERELDDIQTPQDEDLRQKDLDDINVQLMQPEATKISMR